MATEEKEPTMKDVVTAIQALAKQHQSLAGIVKNIQEGALPIKGAEKDPAEGKAAPKKDVDELDLERMSRKDLVKHILSAMQEQLIKPLSESMKAQQEGLVAEKTRKEIEEASKDKHFWEYEAEMTALAKTHPDLSIDELYALARHKSPEKTQKLDEVKAKEEADRKAEEEKNKEPEFLGLFPTSGKAESGGKLKPDEAVRKAWDAVGMDTALAAVAAVRE